MSRVKRVNDLNQKLKTKMAYIILIKLFMIQLCGSS